MQEIEKLKAIGKEILSQDNLCTANPIFLVQRRKTIYGMDLDYSDEVIWLGDDCYEFPKEIQKQLTEAWDNNQETVRIDGEDYDLHDLTRTAKMETWEDIQPFFTNKAALEYIESNAHRHGGKDELRVYIECAFRNEEWQTVRNYLIKLAQEE
jgi:hypothetical protein